MKIYFTRHSKTIWNQEHRLQGSKDSPLTDEGINDAKMLKQRIEEIPITICYTSPILRARRTAEILFDNTLIMEDERLKEINFGDFEGMKVADIADHVDYYNLWHNPYPELRLPNGESLEEVVTRVKASIKDIYAKHKEDTVFMTVHGMIGIIIVLIANDLPITRLTDVNTVMRGCSLSYLEYDGKNFNIHYLGDDSHLPTLQETINYAKQ